MKRKLFIPKVFVIDDVYSNEAIQDFFNDNYDITLDEFFKCMESMYEQDNIPDSIAYIHLDFQDAFVYREIKRDAIIAELQSTLHYYESKEEYEKCSYIKEWINAWKQRLNKI